MPFEIRASGGGELSRLTLYNGSYVVGQTENTLVLADLQRKLVSEVLFRYNNSYSVVKFLFRYYISYSVVKFLFRYSEKVSEVSWTSHADISEARLAPRSLTPKP